jgi:hypothetical protein
LILALIDYEWNQYLGGDRGLSSPHIGDEWTGSVTQLDAIKIRLEGPTNTLRWLNVSSCILTIITLTVRQKLKMDWFNKDLRREIFLGEQRQSHSKFVMLEDESAAGSTIQAGDTDIPAFDDKFKKD